MTLNELPKKNKKLLSAYIYPIDNVNLIYVSCPTCYSTKYAPIGTSVECFRCGTRIKVPKAVGVKNEKI